MNWGLHHAWLEVMENDIPRERRLQELRSELRELVESVEYAYAMGAGCSNGGSHPFYVKIRQRAAHLRARIEEHSG